MSWLGSVGPAVVSSAVVAAGVSALSSVITNRDNLYAAYRLDQKKKLRELIGAYSGQMLEAASDWDRRMHQLYAPNGTDHMAVPEEKLHAHDQYLYLSVVFRFLSLLGIARKFESEAFYIDSRIARPKDLDLARTYDALGRHAEALPLEERARQITEERLGADDMHAALRLGKALLVTEN
jgi:hypothetical protein